MWIAVFGICDMTALTRKLPASRAMRFLGLKVARRFIRQNDGSAAVEFGMVAAPFLALMIVRADAGRALDALRRPALAFLGVLAAGILPFLVADVVAFYEDTIRYGAGTYRIVGYGLSAILVEGGIVDDRDGAYPFALIALLTWVPLTVWLLLVQRRSPDAWVGPAAFAISILWLMFIGRTFNNYYLVWPMTGAVVAALMAVASLRAPDRPEPG
jgi:hypothetical protein